MNAGDITTIAVGSLSFWVMGDRGKEADLQG
jgi:hypothetical protein